MIDRLIYNKIKYLNLKNYHKLDQLYNQINMGKIIMEIMRKIINYLIKIKNIKKFKIRELMGKEI